MFFFFLYDDASIFLEWSAATRDKIHRINMKRKKLAGHITWSTIKVHVDLNVFCTDDILPALVNGEIE
jgi:hypothetical protein